MSHLTRLNDSALDGYLRGDHGELGRRQAIEETYRRGQQSATMGTEDMIARLESLGYGIVSPDTRQRAREDEHCPWCGASEAKPLGVPPPEHLDEELKHLPDDEPS